jgi:hypothetical protein
MSQKYLILVDEQSQSTQLAGIKKYLKFDGIDLVYTEFNPVNYLIRGADGSLSFNESNFRNDFNNIEYFKVADLILCDYNLIADMLNGYNVIRIIRDLKYNKKKKIILYSAQIDEVILDILKSGGSFDEQKENLANLIDSNIEFIKRDGYDQEVIKNIKKDPEFDFENELIKWFHKRDKDTFNYLFPKYKGKSFGEIATELEHKTDISIAFKKELVEQLISYLSTINDL